MKADFGISTLPTERIFFLLVQQLALARDIAAIAFGGHVLAQRADRFARDDASADGRLDGDLEHLPRNQILQALAQHTPAIIGLGAMHDDGQRVHRFGIDQDGEFHQLALGVAVDMVVEARIAACAGFKAIVEIEHHFIERQAVDGHRPVADIGEIHLLAAFFRA
jgi:hypothetical protein